MRNSYLNVKKKLFIVTTIPATLNFFKGNLAFLTTFYHVCAISSEKERLREIAQREGIEYREIPMKRQISLFWDIICLLKFLLLFLRERPDIVHGNTPKASMLSMVASWITRVPVRIYMCHGLRYQGTSGKLRKLLMFMERLSCSCATEVICVSKGVRDTLVNDGICKNEKAVVVGYGSAAGIDLIYFSSNAVKENKSIRQQLDISEKSFVFIFIGRIVADKGINELVSTFSRLTGEGLDLDLILVGAEERDLNPISDSSLEEIRKNKRIHAVGRQSDIRPYLLAADTMVFPSYREGFGMVLIEAAAMGIPAISSDIIGCNEIIMNGINGKLIPTKNAEALYQEMKWFYEHKDLEVMQMKNVTREMVENRYEQKMVWSLLLTEYQRLENR